MPYMGGRMREELERNPVLDEFIGGMRDGEAEPILCDLHVKEEPPKYYDINTNEEIPMPESLRVSMHPRFTDLRQGQVFDLQGERK